MEAGPSQAATMAQGPPHELPKKERKPRHKLKKGKEREENAIKEDTGLSKVTLDKGPVTEASAWAWASLAETPVSNRPPVFTRDYRCVRDFITICHLLTSAVQLLLSNSWVIGEDLCDSYWPSRVYIILLKLRQYIVLVTASGRAYG